MPEKPLNFLPPETDELKGLADVIIPRAQKFLALARAEEGVRVTVPFTFRSILQQKAIWMQGRYILAEVNQARSAAGMPQLTTNAENRIVTKCKPGASMHNYGLAFDCNFYLHGKYLDKYDNPSIPDDVAFWKKVESWAAECGLEWGGHFKGLFDGGHLQYTGGLSFAQIQKGAQPQP